MHIKEPTSGTKPRTVPLGLALGLSAVLLAVTACQGGQPGDPNNRGPFEALLISTGFGQVYPHRIAELDTFGNPTNRIINITSIDDLKANDSPINPVLPISTWPDPGTSDPELPGSSGNGNHFLQIRFSHYLDVKSILSDLGSSLTNSGLTNNIQVLVYDPSTETTSTVKGRGFVGGMTYYDDPTTPALDLKLVQAVVADENGNVTIADSRAQGFPINFPGDEELVQKNTFTFIPDVDDNLQTFETFPKNAVIRVIATAAVLDYRGKSLVREVCTGTTVGPDAISPEVLGNISANAPLQITPGNGQLNVDPEGTIRASFSKPVQPRDVGEFFSTANKTPEFRGVVLNATVANTTVQVLYYADPISYADFCNYIMTPAYVLLGHTVHSVQVTNSIRGIAASTTVGTPANTTFTTGDGPALTNAPVAPEAIYVARSGSDPGVSVIDLNGFGQSTGDFSKYKDPTYLRGFKMNPDLGAPGIVPPLAPGTSNMDAGSEGPLSLTKNTNLSDLLLDQSVVSNVGDIEVGQPLDKIYNNENVNFLTGRANQINPASGGPQWGNIITYAPMPNPPKLKFDPPPNPAFNIFAEEPAVSSTAPVPPCLAASAQSQLTAGNPFSTVKNSVGKFFSLQQTFIGPQPVPGSPAPPFLPCPYQSRQQIGHFLYVLDRRDRSILVVNSNRFQVIDRIKTPDPWEMAMSPNLNLLAVSNFSSNSISFIDTDPGSQTFHQVIQETKVGQGPSAMAWQPEGEDLLVVNSRSNSLSIIGGSDLAVRKTLINQINRPIDIVCTLRPVGVGWNIQIYHAYILSQSGQISIYESGPDGPNGIGFDNVVGQIDIRFRGATAMQPDIVSFNSAVWIAHQDEVGLGQVSHLELTASPVGTLPINQLQGGFILPPNFRDRTWTVNGRIGGSNPTNPGAPRLSGDNPVDIAVDEMQNFGLLPGVTSLYVSNITYALHSGKGHVKITPTGALVPAITPRLMFIALADNGKVDVREINTGKLIRTLSVPGVSGLRSYWSQ